ncbi:MAG: DNA-binding transcriptional LysR family regulator [Desulforhopalus sp.]|jgi:DNA-binding transcriptional LysR family regulator
MKLKPFPSLDDLRALDALARCGTIKGASEELSLTHGAVSRRISRMSKAIGKPITEAKGRSVKLTRAGQIMAEATSEALARIKTGIEEIQGSQSISALVVSCERSVAARWLIPRLSSFQESYPNDQIHLSVGGGTLNFSKEDVDVALRRIDFPIKPSWSITHIFDETMGPVAAPAIVSHYKSGSYIALGSKTREDGWNRWLQTHPELPKPSEIRFLDHHFLVAEAAIAGLGVGLLPRMIALDAVKNEQLVAPNGFDPDGSNYGLIIPTNRVTHPSLGKFQKWLTIIINC